MTRRNPHFKTKPRALGHARNLLLCKTFLADKLVASVAPTSAFAVKRLCRLIDFAKARLIIEYGPGTGAFSSYLLKNMRRDARLILIEQNRDLCLALNHIRRDLRVDLVRGKVQQCFDRLWSNGGRGADYIISGIPFSFLSQQDRSAIVQNSHQTLRNGGALLAYQTFCQPHGHLGAHLKEHFDDVKIMQEVRNLPPLRIFQAIK